MLSGAISRAIREPLVHFALIGAAIFGLYGLTAEPEASPGKSTIVVTAGDVERLGTLWEKRWRRQPTDAELAGLIDEHIREEVLYREALALGLDRDDTVIRRLLRQKFEFVTQDLATAREPEAAELAAWFEANRERYRTEPLLSFSQVFFSIDRRGAAGEREARLVLAGLRAGEGEAEDLGDGTLLERSFERRTAREIELLFGRGFVETLMGLETDVWAGPVVSGYGLHLVRLQERVAGSVPPLPAIEAKIRADWAHEQRQDANEEIYRRLLQRYDVVLAGGLVPMESRAQP